MDSHLRTGKRCKNTYRYKKSTNLCHRTEQGTPIASHNSRSYRRTGKRCKRTYRYNKNRRLCISKVGSPSPVGYESYERLGKRCKKSYRHHKPSGLCVYTKKKRNRKPRVTKESPLTMEQQEEMIESPFNSPVEDKSVVYSPASSIPFNSPVEDKSVVYSPESPIPFNSPVEDKSVLYSPESSDNSVLYSPESPKKTMGIYL
jgi:hypothetical protein